MKKLKSVFCVAILLASLVGNTFATGGAVSQPALTALGTLLSAVVAFVTGDEACRPRQCQQCRPDERGDDGNCRPPAEN